MNPTVAYIANCILGLIMAAFYMLTLHCRWGRVVTLMGMYVVVLISIFWLLLLPDQNIAVKQISAFLINVIGARLFFSDKLPRIAVCSFTILMNEWICELVSLSFFPEYLSSTQEVFQLDPMAQVSLYTIYICLYAFLTWVFSLLFNRVLKSISWRDILSYIFFPFMQLAMVTCGFLPNFYEHVEIVRICIVLLCMISDIGMYYSMRGITQRAELKAANAQLAKQINAEKEHYAALTEQYETIRRMRHDIANHLYTIQALLDNGETEQAAEYAKELLPRHTFHSSLGSCENPVVDAFLYSRIDKARESGIKIQTDVRLPAEIGIPDADMIIALGNMLDNAEEACRGVEEIGRFINIEATAENGCCTILIKNSAEGKAGAKAERIPGLSRGVGLSILEKLAEQYRGTFTCGLKDDCFCTALTMQTNEDNR